MIVSTVGQIGIRAIVSKGWSDLIGPPSEHIYYIDDCPYECLFKHIAAVVHHGVARTTACGLLNGRPTAIVPFLESEYHFVIGNKIVFPRPILSSIGQTSWGRMVYRAGAGPEPIPYSSLIVEYLTAAVQLCLTPVAEAAAQDTAFIIKGESGVDAAVESFHQNQLIERMRCHVMPNQTAVGTCKRGKRDLSYPNPPYRL